MYHVTRLVQSQFLSPWDAALKKNGSVLFAIGDWDKDFFNPINGTTQILWIFLFDRDWTRTIELVCSWQATHP